MKKLIIPVLMMFAFGAATADIRSETKKEQDKAYEAGQKARQRVESGKKANPEKDGYRDMSQGQKDAYKKGYRGD